MAGVEGPVLVRHQNRRLPEMRRQAPREWLRWTRLFFLVIGLAGTGYYVYTACNRYVYQAYENWVFEQVIGGRGTVTFADYLREQTPLGWFVGGRTVEASALPRAQVAPRPVRGQILGRVNVDRLHLSAIVREGVDARTMSVAAGHVPATAMPGEIGNFAIAAHRDTLFRALKGIQIGDTVIFQSPAGTYTYQVVATKVVKPSDVSVLRPDGGGLIAATYRRLDGDNERLLTMITCYPFYYVGVAPSRFIVEARLISANSTTVRTT